MRKKCLLPIFFLNKKCQIKTKAKKITRTGRSDRGTGQHNIRTQRQNSQVEHGH
jgi:hypothetical protein